MRVFTGYIFTESIFLEDVLVFEFDKVRRCRFKIIEQHNGIKQKIDCKICSFIKLF